MSSDNPSRPPEKRILIVEDNELNMKLLNDVLEAYGYGIVKTGSGAAVLGLARRHQPDLVLMDIQLPDVSGLDAVRQLKDDPQTREIPVVICSTTFRDPSHVKKAMSIGAADYIRKPIHPKELFSRVDRIMR